MGQMADPQIIWLHPLNNLEILLVIKKLDNIYQKISHFAPIFERK